MMILEVKTESVAEASDVQAYYKNLGYKVSARTEKHKGQMIIIVQVYPSNYSFKTKGLTK